MWIATMSTEHYQWLAAGNTQEEATEALAQGFLRHLVLLEEINKQTALERFYIKIGVEEDDVAVGDFGRILDEWYGVAVNEVKAGDCLRDNDHVPA